MVERSQEAHGYDNDGELILTGSANAYVATVAQPINGYFQGLRICGKANHTNSGASTLQIFGPNSSTGLGAVAIRKGASTALTGGEIISSKYYDFIYDSANSVFQMMVAGAGTGDVISSGASTDNAIARWNGTAGTVIQNSGVIIDDSNNVTGLNIVTVLDTYRAQGDFPGFWLDETTGGTKGAYVVLDGGELQIQRRATGFGAFEATLFQINLASGLAIFPIGAVRTLVTTVAGLPAAGTAGTGARAYVTDSSVVAAGNFGNNVVAGAVAGVPVYSDGANWKIG